MKKIGKWTRVLALVLAVGTLLSTTGFAAKVDEAEIIMERQTPALDAYQKIWDSFETNSDGDKIWPNEFAGEYVDPERDYKLVLLLTDISPNIQEKYKELSGNPSCLLFEKAEYSLNYLESLKSYVTDLNKAGCLVYEYVASHRSNKLLITVDAEAYANISSTASYLPPADLPIEIIPGEKSSCSLGVEGGRGIYNATSTSGSSVGIGGSYVYNGQTLSNCILICGHGNPRDSVLRWGGSSGTAFAVVKTQVLGTTAATSTNGDFAIAQLGSGYTATNKVLRNSSGSTRNITGTYRTVPINTTLIKYGKSTYETDTWVLAETGVSLVPEAGGYSYYVDNVMRATITETQNAISGGDSGGPVYVYRGGTNEYWLLGIVTAKRGVVGSSSDFIMYFTPILYPQQAGFTVCTS